MATRKKPEPRTLLEHAQREEEDRHARRLAEIKAIGPKLALLDAFAPQLMAQGINLRHREITTYSIYGMKELWIGGSAFIMDGKLLDALLALGFVETSRTEHGTWASVSVKHGRLVLRLTNVPPRQQPPTPAAPVPRESETAPDR